MKNGDARIMIGKLLGTLEFRESDEPLKADVFYNGEHIGRLESVSFLEEQMLPSELYDSIYWTDFALRRPQSLTIKLNPREKNSEPEASHQKTPPF